MDIQQSQDAEDVYFIFLILTSPFLLEAPVLHIVPSHLLFSQQPCGVGKAEKVMDWRWLAKAHPGSITVE